VDSNFIPIPISRFYTDLLKIGLVVQCYGTKELRYEHVLTIRKNSRDDSDRSKMVLPASDATVQIFVKLLVTLQVKMQSKHVSSHQVSDITHT
jgi:hypothetical protein